MNAYKQIDMYKSVITSLKAKEISIESLDKYDLIYSELTISRTKSSMRRISLMSYRRKSSISTASRINKRRN